MLDAGLQTFQHWNLKPETNSPPFTGINFNSHPFLSGRTPTNFPIPTGAEDFTSFKIYWPKKYALLVKHFSSHLNLKTTMIRNYILIALRNFQRQRLFALLNMFGLALGLASSILIFLYVSDELRYDSMHPYYSDTYRIG